MPVSTQCLYFHLGLHADDDGVVEAYTIMKVVGATEDELPLLMNLLAKAPHLNQETAKALLEKIRK